MSTIAIRQFSNDTFSLLDEDGEAHLVAFDEKAVYGLELAFPDSDDDRYRVNALRLTRAMHGAELQQRLTLAEYPSHMEAEEHLAEAKTALFESGRASLPIATIREQTSEYTAGYMVARYPPEAVFRGESASVSVLAVRECGVQTALVGSNLSPHEAAQLAMVLEDAQAEGGAVALLQSAAEEARTHGMIQEQQNLFPTAPHSPLAYLDQRDGLAYQAEIVPPEVEAWGWHEARFAVLPDGEKQQVALLEVFRDALTGDLAGEYLPLSHHSNPSDAEKVREGLVERAFDMEARQVAAGVVENPIWQPMQPEHYDLYERLAGFVHDPDVPPDTVLDSLLVEALRLGAVERSEVVVSEADLQQADLEKEAPAMPNTLKAESQPWQLDLNEDVTHLPPYVTAEYRSPATADAEGIAPVRLRLEGDEAPYGLEVSAPDEAGAVRLAAIKTFDSDILQKPVTESAVLKTYRPSDYDDSVSYLNPRSEALSDARALVYEWGRSDLGHAMGSALLLAQVNGFKGDKLFEQGPTDPFGPVPDARRLETIQAEREWEREAEIFGKDGYRIPQPEGLTHARELGRYGVDPEVEPGQFYGVTVREAHLGAGPDPAYPPVYIVEGMKAWLDKDSHAVGSETVTLDVRGSRAASLQVAEQLADEADLPSRLHQMETLAHQAAMQQQGLALPLLGQVPADHLNLTWREAGLFTQGPPDPQGLSIAAETSTSFPTPHYSRLISPAAYDLPLEEGQAYAFQARRLEELEQRVAPYGVDALAVEAVKRWEVGAEEQQEAVTLGIYYDRAEARHEVDTYVDLAEREGIQAAMSRAARLADVQHGPQWAELGLHINPDVRYGEMFSQGPDDPFLSEREINHITAQYSAANPPQHELLLEVVPVQTGAGQVVGHSVVALDAQWDHAENSRELEEAQAVMAYEVAHFERKPDADFYAASLHEYFYKRDLDTAGTDITPAVDFVKGVQAVNGLGDHQQWLLPHEVGRLAGGDWSLRHEPAEFQPMTVAEVGQPVPLEVVAPALEL